MVNPMNQSDKGKKNSSLENQNGYIAIGVNVNGVDNKKKEKANEAKVTPAVPGTPTKLKTEDENSGLNSPVKMRQDENANRRNTRRRLSSFAVDEETDENLLRGNWSNQFEFLLSCIGYAVGLGNMWRFPYLCYKNGGGAFLIPYLFFLIFSGLPLYFLELSLGQFSSLSPVAIWRLSPIFKGVGWGMILVSGLTCIYYNVIIAWDLHYLFNSFTIGELPWATCGNPWNTDLCLDTSNKTARMLANYTDLTNDLGNDTMDYNDTSMEFLFGGNETVKTKLPSEEYWERRVLNLTPGIDNIGGVQWELFGCLFAAWVAVFLCLIRGVKSIGKVVYVTALAPYVILLILLIRGVTLPGALEGIKFFIIPDFNKLASFKVWGDAAMQIFFSMGAGWGAIITMSSYNKFNNNCLRDSLIIPLMNSGTSLFCGFVIFSILGFMAHEAGTTVDKVAAQGPGLIFVAYPAALAKLPAAPVWAILFFLMIFSVGLGSQFGMFETMTSAFADEFRSLRDNKLWVTLALCVVEFILGIPCVMNGGVYVLQVMDWYCSTFTLMVIAFVECIVIGYVYGAERFFSDIELMIGRRPNVWFKISWKFITPFLIVFVLIANIVTHESVTYGEYRYPDWSIALGWMFASCSMIPIPIVAIVALTKMAKGSMLERVKALLKPTPEWGPALAFHRQRYIQSLEDEKKDNVKSFVYSMEAFSQNKTNNSGRPEDAALI